MRYTDPSGHIAPIKCFILCPGSEPIDISDWSWVGQAAAKVGCFLLLPCEVDSEQGVISPLSVDGYSEYLNGQLVGMGMPLNVGSKFVSFGGKSFIRQHLDDVLARGKKYVYAATGDLVERLPGQVRQYDIIRYGADALRRGSGLEAHHGVMDAWFHGNNFPGYNTLDAPAMMLDPADHARATAVFNDWAIDRFGATQNIDWAVVTQDEIMGLSKNMFDAAGVPQHAQNNYFATFWYYINTLGD